MEKDYSRLNSFIQKLSTYIYPEPSSNMHSNMSLQAFKLMMETYKISQGRVLDIGCGDGFALKYMTELGFTPSGITMGDEFDQVKKAGFDVHKMDMSFLGFAPDTFDIIWCRHALEHSIFPLFTLSEFMRVLKPGGILYVEVPGADTSCHHEKNPNHYSIFPKSSWINLFEKAGFINLNKILFKFASGMESDEYWGFFMNKPAIKND